jgi:hypothetical protein
MSAGPITQWFYVSISVISDKIEVYQTIADDGDIDVIVAW